jgi:predicted O-methyltransferase YrrM
MGARPKPDPLWVDVDRYIEQHLLPVDPVLVATLAANRAAGLPAIDVAPNQGKMLHLLARLARARHILEIGTLGGYSTIWLARALPEGGHLVTLEANPAHATVARRNLERAGLTAVVELIEGPALATLARLAGENREPFDFVFVDADKPASADYFDWALRLTRPGSALVFDNVVRRGEILDPSGADADALVMRRLHERIQAEPRVSATVVQTVGVKGHDGFTLALVTG